MSRPISSESVFRAVAHATRRRVVELLVKRPMRPSELATHFRHSGAALSRHLRVLESAGLIEPRRQGTTISYRLVPGAFASLQQWVARLPSTDAPVSARPKR